MGVGAVAGLMAADLPVPGYGRAGSCPLTVQRAQ